MLSAREVSPPQALRIPKLDRGARPGVFANGLLELVICGALAIDESARQFGWLFALQAGMSGDRVIAGITMERR